MAKGGVVVDMYAFKSIIKRKNPHHYKLFKQLESEIRKKKPVKIKKTKGDTAYMLFMSDWQLGKKDYGSINTVKHIRQAIEKAKVNIKNINKTDAQIDEIYLKPRQHKKFIPRLGEFMVFPSWVNYSFIPFNCDGTLRVLSSNLKVNFTTINK